LAVCNRAHPTAINKNPMTVTQHNVYNCDVAVIGAGIVGCYAASALAKIGYNVRVLDKNATFGAKNVCTGIISRQCLNLLPAAGQCIQYEASSASIFSPRGARLHLQRETPQAFVLDRPSLDRLMAASAKKSGAIFHLSTQVSSILNLGNAIRLEGNMGDEPCSIEARIALITSGSGTSLTRLAGLGQIQQHAYGAQADVHIKDLHEVEVYSGTDIAPGFFAWIVPTGKESAKLGLLCSRDPKDYMKALLNGLRQSGRFEGEEPEIRYGTVPLRPLARTFGERLLVAGDAAGQVKPTTGGGIYYGLLCAGFAVQTVDEALKDADVSARRLSLYQRRWHRLLKQELSIDYWAHRFYSGLGNKQIEHIFGIIERHGIHDSILASPDITFDWHGKAILDALKHRSLQRSLEKLGLGPAPQKGGRIR
jgi:digeranylgeranylglycerophospholipid reductase